MQYHAALWHSMVDFGGLVSLVRANKSVSLWLVDILPSWIIYGNRVIQGVLGSAVWSARELWSAYLGWDRRQVVQLGLAVWSPQVLRSAPSVIEVWSVYTVLSKGQPAGHVRLSYLHVALSSSLLHYLWLTLSVNPDQMKPSYIYPTESSSERRLGE